MRILQSFLAFWTPSLAMGERAGYLLARKETQLLDARLVKSSAEADVVDLEEQVRILQRELAVVAKTTRLEMGDYYFTKE